MAMRSIMKKISPKIRFTEGLRIPRCFSNVAYTRYILNNEALLCGLEKLLKDGSKVTEATRDEWWENVRSRGGQSEIDKRWENWVESSHKLWKKKSEEEQRRELNMQWTYLKDLLHREGIDTSHHRLLLSMRIILPDRGSKIPSEGGTLEFKIASPDRGLVSINRLVFDRGHFWRYCLPKQIVNGLLCFTENRRHAFLIYNPVTGETSPWIEMNKKPERYSSIAFGFDPQSDEHKVVCVSNSTEFSWREKISNRPKDQVVDVFTIGKNSWRRIDAIPPIAISCEEDPFYVDGCLYWRFRQEYEDGELEHIMRFDIVTEKFTVIPIPDFVIDPDRYKFTQTVGLTEIDGRIYSCIRLGI
ncbi:hypothetical protein C5167_038113 [Papaver somniferum]|uniref:F-box associated beta-propeller type 3 domain-containing protein n=1 Tax=Papaver somniferum TaxID=3469 RepID=A0A4Y7IBR2_PAPSO|nr:hypothetical protein C5167_038113 [Papaver somniferum]